MKTNIILFVLVSILLCSECGVVQNIYGGVINKTQEVRQGVTNWLLSGVDLLFSDKPEHMYNEGVNEAKNAVTVTGDEIEKSNGIIRSIYDGVKNKFSAVGSKVYTTFFSKDDENPKNGFVSNIYHRVQNYTIRMKNKVFENSEYQKENFIAKTKKIRDSLRKFLSLNITDNTTVPGSISFEDLKIAHKVQVDAVEHKLKDMSVKIGNDTIINDVKGVLRKTIEEVKENV